VRSSEYSEQPDVERGRESETERVAQFRARARSRANRDILRVAVAASVKRRSTRATANGGDVPRYPYAICMEENMRTPVYNLAAVADGRFI